MTKYHPRVTTNSHIRKLIQDSKESGRVLAERFGINRKTVIKWRKRQGVEDAAKYLTPYQKMVEYHQSLDEEKRNQRFKKRSVVDRVVVPLYHAT